MAEEEGEEEEDSPYDEVRFSKIPEEFLSNSEVPTQDVVRIQPLLEPEGSDDVANGQVACRARDSHGSEGEGKEEENTEF